MPPRARLPEIGDRREHDGRAQGAQRLVPKTEALEVPRHERFDDDIGRRREPQQQLATLGAGDVQRHAALAGVHVEEEEAAVAPGLVAPEGRDAARRVAARPLDLDDVGAHVREELAAVDPFLVGELEDTPPGEGGGRAGGLHVSFVQWGASSGGRRGGRARVMRASADGLEKGSRAST